MAKAIRDGGIDAVLDHEGAFMASKEVGIAAALPYAALGCMSRSACDAAAFG